jgi:two-component system, chemotaxis family, chemotaxis protein CheY
MKRAMVVDDSLTVRLYVRQVLEALGDLEVVDAQNGIEGLEKALLTPVDLLIVDVNMPKMDGYSFVREVRGRAALRAIPIIMATTEDKDADRDRAYSVGANFYLSKPLSPEALTGAALMLMGRSR